MLLAALLSTVLAQAPASYNAVTDRGPRAEPSLVKLGNAGFSFNDPAFGTRIWRVTDRLTRPDAPDRSFRTPSATHQSAWSADGSYFYVVSNGGTIVPFAFDPDSGRFSRLATLRFYIEPQFSYVDNARIYGSVTGSGASLRTIDQFDFGTGVYTRLLDLDTLATGLQGTFVGGIASSAGATERIIAFFGGSSQDRHHYVVVFDRANPARRRLLDTAESRLDGYRLKKPLNINLHHAAIDRSGRYVALYPAAADLAAPRKAAPVYMWDTLTDIITAMPETDALSSGHDAYGYGVAVNKDCCSAKTPWDAAQWQLRSLDAPLVAHDLIRPLLSPKEVSLSDHPTWNNARPDRLVPFVSATYRYGTDKPEWRAWDNELVAVQTDIGDGSAEVWRLAHHRSDVSNDDAPGDISFWYTPRPNVSRDGRWVLFTSNWAKTLGTDPQGAAGEKARQDVFLVRLPAVDANGETPYQPLQITTTSLPDGRAGRTYSATLQASRRATWYVTFGSLPPGLRLTAAGELAGSPTETGSWTFELTAAESAGFVPRTFTLNVTK
jgi:Putative Ig domain